MFEEIFLRKKVSFSKLMRYGFREHETGYFYTVAILEGDFLLTIFCDRQGNVDTSLVETETGEEYILYKTPAQGVFVGDVRKAIGEVLADVAGKCFVSAVFRQEQTLHFLDYAREVYGDEAEFLWEKSSDSGILRRKDSNKWYAAIMKLARNKLGEEASEVVEIVDLHVPTEKIAELLTCPGIYPGWHMNKKHWITVVLDGSLPDEVLYELVRESYRLAGRSG